MKRALIVSAVVVGVLSLGAATLAFAANGEDTGWPASGMPPAAAA